jgi:hypothetical protein
MVVLEKGNVHNLKNSGLRRGRSGSEPGSREQPRQSLMLMRSQQRGGKTKIRGKLIDRMSHKAKGTAEQSAVRLIYPLIPASLLDAGVTANRQFGTSGVCSTLPLGMSAKAMPNPSMGPAHFPKLC